MAYSIHIRKKALKALSKLPKKVQLQLKEAIDGLSEDPRPTGVKKFTARENTWRIRIGNYRVVYQVEDEKLLVLVINLGHRKDVYR